MKQKVLVLVTVFLCITGSLFAQRYDADLNLFLGLPQGDFDENVDRISVGINGSAAFPIPGTFVQLGMELGAMTFGTDSRKERFSSTIPITVRVDTDYNIVNGHLFMRFESHGNIRPYLDVLYGFNYLFTETHVRDRDDFDDIASDTNYDDWAVSYGAGGGIKFKVYESAGTAVLINLKARYLKGGEATYLKPGSAELRNGDLYFDQETSTTDLLSIHVGAAFKF